jgi:hypothetical protein
MSIKAIKYFRQSDSNHHSLVALDAWQIRVRKDAAAENIKNINSVTFKVLGNSHTFYYSDFIKAIQQKSNYVSDLTGPPLPIAVRAIQDNIYVIERPPFKTSVRLTGARAARVKKEASILCEVWIPWTVSILTMPTEDNHGPSLKMFYNDGPLSSLEDLLITPWTPNFHYSGEICLGQTSSNFMDAVAHNNVNPNSVTEVYHYLVNDYFNGGWNLDLGGGLISTLCNYSIGKFTNNILQDPDLHARAKQRKIKFKDTTQIRARESTRIKNAYITWSLLDLSEVLNAVTLYRETNRPHFKLNALFDKDESAISEKESIRSLVRSIYLSNSSSVKNGPDWDIVIKFSKETIVAELVKDNVLSSAEGVEDFTSIYSNSLCEQAALRLIDNNQELFSSFIRAALEFISVSILEGSTDSQKIEFDFENIIKNKEASHSLEGENITI